MRIAHHHDHHARQTSTPSSKSAPGVDAAVQDGNTTVVIVCPTASVVITSADNVTTSQANLDRTVIIVLSVLCLILLGIIIGLLLWFRKTISRRLNGKIRAQAMVAGHDDGGLEMRTTRGTSAGLIDGETRRSSSGAVATGRTSKESRRTSSGIPAVHQRPPRSLVIDSNLAVFATPIGGGEPRTTGWLDTFEQKTSPSGDGLRPTYRNARAVSYPSDAYFPNTPDSAFPLMQPSNDSSSTLAPPSPFNPLNTTIQQHRRLHTVHEVDSVRSLPVHASSPADRQPSPRLVLPTEYHTPLGSTPELLPSPPPSPTHTITSPSPARRSSDASTSLSSGGQPRNASQRPNTAASSSHMSVSSTSGSSARFSSLFFAPMGSTPPKQNPMGDAVSSSL